MSREAGPSTVEDGTTRRRLAGGVKRRRRSRRRCGAPSAGWRIGDRVRERVRDADAVEVEENARDADDDRAQQRFDILSRAAVWWSKRSTRHKRSLTNSWMNYERRRRRTMRNSTKRTCADACTMRSTCSWRWKSSRRIF